MIDVVFFFAVVLLMVLIVTLLYFIKLNEESKTKEEYVEEIENSNIQLSFYKKLEIFKDENDKLKNKPDKKIFKL